MYFIPSKKKCEIGDPKCSLCKRVMHYAGTDFDVIGWGTDFHRFKCQKCNKWTTTYERKEGGVIFERKKK